MEDKIEFKIEPFPEEMDYLKKTFDKLKEERPDLFKDKPNRMRNWSRLPPVYPD